MDPAMSKHSEEEGEIPEVAPDLPQKDDGETSNQVPRDITVELFGEDVDEQETSEPPKHDGNSLAEDLNVEMFGEDVDEERTDEQIEAHPSRILEEKSRLEQEIPVETIQNLEDFGAPVHIEIPLSQRNFCPELLYSKLPSFLEIQPECFDPDTFIMEDDSSERKFVIRWRLQKDPETGKLTRESNSRIVTWDDGTASLFVGDEAYDLTTFPLVGSHNLLFAFLEETGAIQQLGNMSAKAAFRPSSLMSKTHITLSKAVSDHSKIETKHIKMVHTTEDPEMQHERLVNAEEQVIHGRHILKSKRQKVMDKIQDANTESVVDVEFLEAGQEQQPEDEIFNGDVNKVKSSAAPLEDLDQAEEVEYVEEVSQEPKESTQSRRKGKRKILDDQ